LRFFTILQRKYNSHSITDLHSVWDTLIIAKALRSVPRKYNRAIPAKQVEQVLRGTIYDSYIRQVMWEGVIGDKWKDEVNTWLQCPSSTRVEAPGEQLVLGDNRKTAGSTGDPAQWDTDTVCPYAWSSPIHKLNCDIVWPASTDSEPGGGDDDDDLHAYTVEEEMAMAMREDDDLVGHGHGHGHEDDDNLPDLDTPEYSGKIEKAWIIEELLAKGGVRLGAVLNGLFANSGN
jgi:hypothetical protein